MNELSFLNTSTRSFTQSQPETQETQGSQSLNYSDASSIAHFPTFHFSLHSLASPTQLAKQKVAGSMKISTLMAVLEVEGPDTIRIKQGRDAGKEVAILKMILGDEGGTICKLTAWREVAERWGGQHGVVAVKRGDVVFIESAYLLLSCCCVSVTVLIPSVSIRCDCHIRPENLACLHSFTLPEVFSDHMLSHNAI